jgi:hypothetical protein
MTIARARRGDVEIACETFGGEPGGWRGGGDPNGSPPLVQARLLHYDWPSRLLIGSLALSSRIPGTT